MRAILLVSPLLILAAISPPPAFAQAGGQKPFEPPPAPVELAPVVKKQVSAAIELVGTVHPRTASVVAAQTPGRVISFGRIEGEKVGRGEIVVLLDETPYKIAVRAADGRLKKALASLEKAMLAEKRAIELYDQHVASVEAMNNARLEARAAEADVELNKAELDRAEYELGLCKADAPFDGYIASRLVEAGEWVKEGEGLFEIMDLNRVDVVVEAPERKIEAFARGKRAVFTLDAHPGREYEGKIRAVSPKGDVKTRAFMIKIDADNSRGDMLSGMVARVRVDSEEAAAALMIHRDAVVWQGRKPVVFTAGDDGRAKAVFITLGRQHGELVEVSGDVHEGLKLVVTGNEILRDGQAVKVVGEKKID